MNLLGAFWSWLVASPLRAWWPWASPCLGCGQASLEACCPPCWARWLGKAARGWVACDGAWAGPSLAWQSHQDLPKALVHRLKIRGQASAARLLAEAMVPLVPDGPWLIVPMPSSPSRLAKRGHWPAGRLAREVARRGAWACATSLLHRAGRTRSQVGLGRAGRLALDAGAFRLRSGRQLKGRDILLVDDVLVTGATSGAAAQLLLDAGASRVLLLVATQAGGRVLAPTPQGGHQGVRVVARRPSAPK